MPLKTTSVNTDFQDFVEWKSSQYHFFECSSNEETETVGMGLDWFLRNKECLIGGFFETWRLFSIVFASNNRLTTQQLGNFKGIIIHSS